ncbi:hypothetical protein POM88_034833 [Heracleum sosnowskyi]|uniref:Replication factor A C-terminal domain-containing protein n=1 Tax=Heracleum sosnowskyi TaxID=360622 RepID=A0AAD8HLA9_9APIA|nr:hypothetical protein POM88_034833 [Heracleum sosnowskyi]
MFDQFEMLDPARTNKKVKVRITRMWASVSTAGSKDGSNSVTGYNAILLDDDRNVMCFVTIKMVETDDSWWYYGCNFCHEEVHLLEGRYKCVNPKCLKSSPYAEKRIMVLAHDKTEAVNVVISDRAIKRLVGKTATMLLEEIEDLAETPPSTFFPQQILDIANKDVTFNILISDDNVLINITMYNATDAYLSKKSKSSTSKTIEEILEST